MTNSIYLEEKKELKSTDKDEEWEARLEHARKEEEMRKLQDELISIKRRKKSNLPRENRKEDSVVIQITDSPVRYEERNHNLI
jgi:hypothetical protein